MFRLFLVLVILSSLTTRLTATQDAENIIKKSKSDFFIENKGQWNPEVRFLARISGMNAWNKQECIDCHSIEEILYSGNELIKGKYTVDTDLNDLGSGLYFIILQTATVRKAEKVEIVK